MAISNGPPMYHGKFIPNESHPLPFLSRLAIGVGLAILIAILFMLSVNVLQSWGEWVTVLILIGITGGALGLWIQDALRHPASSLDKEDQ